MPAETDLEARRAHLASLATEVRRTSEEFARAVDADFGGRPRAETVLAEVGMVLENIRWTLRRLRRWVGPERVRLSPEFWPSRGRVERVPLGVVGILSPWNYPLQLALVPLVAALAGGNRVILRPSEFTPRTAALIAEVVERAVGERVRVVLGGSDVAEALTRLPLDGLFYTGSTATGRRVLAAAAENLTPVTLELGGKSPTVVLPDANLSRAARSIMAGKLFSAGQTCVAPDYLMVPAAQVPEVLAALRQATERLYPDPAGRDYAALARPADRERLASLIADVDAVPLMAQMPPPPRFGAWAVVDPDPKGALMREEIFGPILPIVSYDDVAEAVEFRERPALSARPLRLRAERAGVRGGRRGHALGRSHDQRQRDPRCVPRARVWRGGSVRDGRLPRRGGLPRLHPAEEHPRPLAPCTDRPGAPPLCIPCRATHPLSAAVRRP